VRITRIVIRTLNSAQNSPVCSEFRTSGQAA